MSRRKASNPRRKDSDFDRNGKLLISKESAVNSNRSSRQLFDPRSDNPLAFNKQQPKSEDGYDATARKPQPRQHLAPSLATNSPQREKPDNGLPWPSQRPPPAPGRRLWSADAPEAPKLSTPINNDKPTTRTLLPAISKPVANKKLQSGSNERKVASNQTKQPKATAPVSEDDAATDIKRNKLKALISSLKSIEAKLEQVAVSSRSLPCFNDSSGSSQQTILHHRRDMPTGDIKVISGEHIVIVEQDILDAEAFWKEKIDLHLSLGEKYLEILTFDLEYAEKKGLESLCWKRAVYSLVDQFRKALRKSASDIAALSAASPATANSGETTKVQSELAAMLFEDQESSDGSLTEIPVVHEGGGMTFIKVENPKPQETYLHERKLHLKQARMTLNLFLYYLEMADDFCLKLALFLKSVDDDSNVSMDAYLNLWRRTRKYKWYTCIPLRGDIARYRWAYTLEKEDLSELLTEDMKEKEDQEPTSKWTKEDALKEAWKFYALGTWLMPAKGNLYFNLSLLLQQPPHLHTQGHDFHKLYFSTRSLMVRRNGFLNARESLLALFESNRRWVQKNIESARTHNSSKQRQRRPKSTKMDTGLDKDSVIPSVFVRLHGMLFTKIGLDEFPRIKRVFFESLFEINHAQQKQDGYDQPIVVDNKTKPALHDPKKLSESHLFWLETAIVCLSSLYTYDFANSKFTKLLSSNCAKRFNLDNSNEQQYQQLSEEIGDSVLFSHEVDLTCQIAVELLRRYLDPLLPSPSVPQLPRLPNVNFNYIENEDFLFGPVLDHEKNRIHKAAADKDEKIDVNDTYAWLVYIEILLHWMVLNGVCIRSQDQMSLWEAIVGDIGYDFIFPQGKRLTAANGNRNSKISPAFWPLLLQFLNKLLSELPTEDKYDMVNKHLLEDDGEDKKNMQEKYDSNSGNKATNIKSSDLEYEFTKKILAILGKEPDLPEESLLRGLGWVDEIHGRFLKLEPDAKPTRAISSDKKTIYRRKMKILDYGFTLVRHLDNILCYDPVEEMFAISKSVEERAVAVANEVIINTEKPENCADEACNDIQDNDSLIGTTTTITEMDDDILLSSEANFDEHNEGDDFMTQLKKRREQLQSIVVSCEAEERFGFRRIPARVKEREARLDYLRNCIVPGKTILVLDTNCFIGHLDLVKKLVNGQKWSIIIPLVVITELDGLRTNTHRLGLMAQQGIELLETSLAAKPKQSNSLRIQTSHNNFMNDISIRSEQFVFGESDKNLDDLILSCCLWWTSQQLPQENNNKKILPVCLVTGDRNLSVKARAREVEVVPVTAINQLTPK
ncbi:hypothetical protein [Parasitella parasitica]|uniref:PIN domain-containing protein n=1 Tax=Parasitella parasitica TaxID=35722 RepID=A0A0B7MXF4_9FUNG|nr:hypothetical protein [Parasitella parasitica]